MIKVDPGTLYVVATPIGNREDLSSRALKILQSVDLILAEDTRHSKELLLSLGIKKPMQSLHAHNEEEKSRQYLEVLLKGQSLALISDAGTPLISDPGFTLIQLARKQELPVVPIPGACAFVTALSAAGIPCDSFLFLGFLPAKRTARQAKLDSLKLMPYTLIFYESKHRIVETIEDIMQIYGEESPLVLAKELTKAHECFINANAAQVRQWLLAKAEHGKGEFVLMIPPRPLLSQPQEYDDLLQILLAELPLKQAVTIAMKVTGENKNVLYQRALMLKDLPSS
jgi:16S rRNA (cytidine1402-2'-O)-methyltransferase